MEVSSSKINTAILFFYQVLTRDTRRIIRKLKEQHHTKRKWFAKRFIPVPDKDYSKTHDAENSLIA